MIQSFFIKNKKIKNNVVLYKNVLNKDNYYINHDKYL